MAITVGVDETGRVTVEDSSEGVLFTLEFPASITCTEYSCGRIAIADNATAATVPFGGVSSAKVIYLRNRTDQEIAVNVTDPASTWATQIQESLLLMNGDGYWTAVTIDNDVEGTSALDVEYLVAG